MKSSRDTAYNTSDYGSPDHESTDTPATDSDTDDTDTDESGFKSLKKEQALELAKKEANRLLSNYPSLASENHYKFKKDVGSQRKIIQIAFKLYSQDTSLFDNYFLSACASNICNTWKNRLKSLEFGSMEELWKKLEMCYQWSKREKLREKHQKAHKDVTALITRLIQPSSVNELHWKLNKHQEMMVEINSSETFPIPQYENTHLEIAKTYCFATLETRYHDHVAATKSIVDLISVFDSIYPLGTYYHRYYYLN